MRRFLGENLRGPLGEAQQIIYELGPRDDKAWSATKATWFLTCPGQSAGWDHYMLNVITLADIEGVPPAHKQFPSATHELMLAALDPTRHPTPLKKITPGWYLTPLNLVEQVELPGDDEAKLLIRWAVEAVLQGQLWAEPPLSGQKEPWHTVLIRSAAHLRGEAHESGIGAGVVWSEGESPCGD